MLGTRGMYCGVGGHFHSFTARSGSRAPFMYRVGNTNNTCRIYRTNSTTSSPGLLKNVFGKLF